MQNRQLAELAPVQVGLGLGANWTRPFAATAAVLVLLLPLSLKSLRSETPVSDQTSLSPDKRWEYRPDESDPKIVKAGTNEVAFDLSDQPAGNGFSSATVIWAPDSKRFAFNYGQGRTHAASLYQLRGNEWKALKLPDDEDKILQRADDIVAGQLKRKGLSKEKLSKKDLYLRLIWWTVKLDRWVDSNTAILYASLWQVAANRDDSGEMSDGFGADLLFTLKFDEAGNWKIIKTHQMSEKEAEKREKDQ